MIHQRHGRTDGRTDRRHAIAIPRFALKALLIYHSMTVWRPWPFSKCKHNCMVP